MSEPAVGTLLRASMMAVGCLGILAGEVGAQSWRTLTSARQAWGTEPVTVEVEYGAGHLEIGAADRPMLYRMELRYDEDRFTPVTAYDGDQRHLRLGLRSRDGKRVGNIREGARSRITLSREVPLDLDLSFGAGEADIELGGMRVRRLDLSTGASETHVRFGSPNRIRADRVSVSAGAAELKLSQLGNARADQFHFQGGVGATELDFSGAWEGSATASVKMGIGSLVLRFPRGLGVRINKSSFLTSFEADGLIKRGNAYFSGNWDSARNRLTVDVEAALGSVEVRWID